MRPLSGCRHKPLGAPETIPAALTRVFSDSRGHARGEPAKSARHGARPADRPAQSCASLRDVWRSRRTARGTRDGVESELQGQVRILCGHRRRRPWRERRPSQEKLRRKSGHAFQHYLGKWSVLADAPSQYDAHGNLSSIALRWKDEPRGGTQLRVTYDFHTETFVLRGQRRTRRRCDQRLNEEDLQRPLTPPAAWLYSRPGR